MSAPAPADPLGPLAAVLAALQARAAQDAEALANLRGEVGELRRVQEAQQAEIDAVRAERGASEKLGAGLGREGEERGDSAGAGAGRKRARSTSDTAEQQGQTQPTARADSEALQAVLTKLSELEARTTAEALATRAAVAEVGRGDDACGHAAENAARDLERTLSEVGCTVLKATKAKLEAVESALLRKMAALEANTLAAIEAVSRGRGDGYDGDDFNDGCEDGDEYAEVEAQRAATQATVPAKPSVPTLSATAASTQPATATATHPASTAAPRFIPSSLPLAASPARQGPSVHQHLPPYHPFAPTPWLHGQAYAPPYVPAASKTDSVAAWSAGPSARSRAGQRLARKAEELDEYHGCS